MKRGEEKEKIKRGRGRDHGREGGIKGEMQRKRGGEGCKRDQTRSKRDKTRRKREQKRENKEEKGGKERKRGE